MLKESKELITKIINKCMIYEIRDSELYLKFLTNQANFYQNELNLLEETKPFFFQKEKLEEYNKKIKEQKQKIFDIYMKIEEEMNCINEMQNSISD